MEAERPLIRSLITDSGIIIAIIPLISYLCTIANQIGYLNYFRVPIEFVSLSPTIILQTSLQLAAYVGMILIALFFLIDLTSQMINHIISRLPRLHRILFGEQNQAIRTPIPAQHRPNNAFIAMLIFVSILSLIGFTRYRGKVGAEYREEFYTVNNFPNLPDSLVVMGVSGDLIVTASFDRTTKEVDRKIYILKQSEMNNIPLTLEKIGRLKVKE